MTISPSNPGESPEMTQREEFVKAVEEECLAFVGDVIRRMETAGYGRALLGRFWDEAKIALDEEDAVAARGYLLKLWDGQQAELERLRDSLNPVRLNQIANILYRIADCGVRTHSSPVLRQEADWLRRLSGSPREERSDV